MTGREGSIIKAIQRRAEKVPGLMLRKRHGTVAGFGGDPDLYGSYRGRHFEVEVKQPGESAKPLQAERLKQWAAAGAITGVAHHADEFFHILLAATDVPASPQSVLLVNGKADPEGWLPAAVTKVTDVACNVDDSRLYRWTAHPDGGSRYKLLRRTSDL